MCCKSLDNARGNAVMPQVNTLYATFETRQKGSVNTAENAAGINSLFKTDKLLGRYRRCRLFVLVTFLVLPNSNSPLCFSKMMTVLVYQLACQLWFTLLSSFSSYIPLTCFRSPVNALLVLSSPGSLLGNYGFPRELNNTFPCRPTICNTGAEGGGLGDPFQTSSLSISIPIGYSALSADQFANNSITLNRFPKTGAVMI